jgi:hypothetical protein
MIFKTTRHELINDSMSLVTLLHLKGGYATWHSPVHHILETHCESVVTTTNLPKFHLLTKTLLLTGSPTSVVTYVKGQVLYASR